jgi:predicted O-methyltransferase YrrM
MANEKASQQSGPNPIARALSGWQPARVLMAANRLRVFDALDTDALTAEEVANRCQAHPRSMRLLLNACVALNFVERDGERYRNTPLGLDMLVEGGKSYIGGAIAHSDDLWLPWGFLVQSVKENKRASLPDSWPARKTGYRDFILAMRDRAMRNGEILANELDLTGRRQLFDCGGGPGTYSVFLARKNPELRAIVFDLAPAIEIAKEIIAEAGMSDRITTRVGDYFVDDFGHGNDVLLLSAIVHSMGPERNKMLVRKAWDSLASGGIVVVHESLVDESGTSPTGAVLFSLNMLVNTGEGQSYGGREIVSWLSEAGFESPHVQHLSPPAGTSLVIGTKP